MDRDFSNLFLGGLCIGQFLLLFVLAAIAGHLSKIVERLTGLMLAVQELCDRIWELRNE